MGKENEKKGFFKRLLRIDNTKKSSCCCGNYEIEEVPEEQGDKSNKKTPKDKKGNSCCG